MTGFVIRVKTDEGAWVHKDIDEATPMEMDRFIAGQRAGEADGWGWVKKLAQWIKDNTTLAVTPPDLE